MSPTDTAQWLPVLLVPRADGKTDKLPCDYRTGTVGVNAHDPAHWTTYETARAYVAPLGPAYTVGFVITAADPWFCLDIDGAATPAGWSPLAQQLVAELPGCMIEVSQSGKGLHVWGRHPAPGPHIMKRTDLHVELYTELRFIAWGTGHTGTVDPVCHALPAFIAKWFPPRAQGPGTAHGDGPRPDWRGPEDDEELLRRALASRSASSVFGGATRAAFADLWRNDLDVLRQAYPGDGDGGVDRSSVDAACAQHLAFWTGCDQARMQRLMLRSGLVREKYDREDYLPRTIASACAMQRDVLQDKPVVAPGPSLAAPGPALATVPPAPSLTPLDAPSAPVAAAATMTARAEATYIHPAQFPERFAGCVYIKDLHRVLCRGGHLYKPEQFKVVYGGVTYVMDAKGERTTRDAFEAFTQSQAVACPMTDGTCFRPDLPYGEILTSEGRTRANVYWPAQVVATPGDAGPFLRHLAKLLPDADEQRWLLYYMAGCVQFQGHKFQWFPLVVGVEGNGKSLLSRCVAYAVGQRYTHWPAADKLGKDFNAWLFGKVFFAIEDLALGDAAATWEKLKPMITGENIEIEGKGIDQRTDEICGNFMANSNHKNAVRATQNDRRVMHLWCAQQSEADLARDEMTQEYMSGLYDWLRHAGGFAIVAHMLRAMAIPAEFGLSWLKGRAPKTKSTEAALSAAMGPVEQEVLEAIEREETGFRGGWVSSGYLDSLLQRVGKERAVARNKRREVMQTLGYDWHPTLAEGRVHNTVMPDGAKVKLFVKRDRADLLALATAAEVARSYTAAQGLSGR